MSAWPAYSLTFVIPFAVGAYAGTEWEKALIGFASLFFVGAFSFALNFYSDRDTDRYHDGAQKDFDLRKQPMLTGEISEREAQAFCVLTFVAAGVLGFLAGELFGGFALMAALVGGVLYSHPRIRLKAKPLGDVACISALGVLLPSSGFLLGAGELPTPLMMLFWFLVTGTGYIATVMSDYRFDISARLRTTATFLGQRGAMATMVVFFILSVIVLVFVFRWDYPVGTKYFAGFACGVLAVLTVYVWRSVRREPEKVRVPLFSRTGGWIYLVPGIVSLLFLAYGFVKILLPDLLPADPFLTPEELDSF